MYYQDWKEVKFINKNSNKKETKKKINTNTGWNKVDKTEIESIKKIKLVTSRIISKKRTELKLSQKELANKLNIKPEVITSYENGKAIPNGHILNNLQKILGIYVSGNKIGQKLGSK